VVRALEEYAKHTYQAPEFAKLEEMLGARGGIGEGAEGPSLRERVSEITGLTGTALTIYLIISEGSRLFPPRNIIPVP
jgi:hypothetical protein